MEISYPFQPKSTSSLIPGQFWPIKLSDGRFACGRVLQVNVKYRRVFIAGLMSWVGDASAEADDLDGYQVIEHGSMHIKGILIRDQFIVGYRDLAKDNIEVPLSLDSSPHINSRIQQGFDVFSRADESQLKTLNFFSTWGYNVINIRADRHHSNR